MRGLPAILLLLGPAAALAGEGAGARAADAGSFAIWSVASRLGADAAIARASGAYDAAARGVRLETTLEMRLVERLAVRAGVAHADAEERLRPVAGLRLDALRQEASGVDLAVTSGYEPFGFNGVPAFATSLSLGRASGRTRWLASAGYAQGLEAGERSGDLRAAAFHRVGRGVLVGLDSRLRVDLERDLDEPAGEPDWDVVAGPSATITAGPLAVTAGAGVSALRLRLDPVTSVGPVVHLAVGAAY